MYRSFSKVPLTTFPRVNNTTSYFNTIKTPQIYNQSRLITPIIKIHSRSYGSSTNSNTQVRIKKNYTWAYFLAGASLLPIGYWMLQKEENKLEAEQAIPLNTEDTVAIFHNKPTSELIFSLFILKLTSLDSLTEFGWKFLDISKKLHLTWITYPFLKATFFKKFVAGETLEESMKVVDKLSSEGLGSILDYSVESGTDFEGVASQVVKTIHMSADFPAKIPFACLKVSGLGEHEILGRVTSILDYQNENPNYKILWIDGAQSNDPKSPEPLTLEEIRKFQELVTRLDKICAVANEKNVKLLIDAEQTYYQKAIDYLVLKMIVKYNKKDAVVFNTYQMYLKDSLKRMERHLELSKKDNVHLGVKLVRGAYMEGERKRANEMNYSSPILPTIEDTHNSYNSGIQFLLDNIDNVGVLIASHNEDSVKFAYKLIQMKNIPSDKVHFAQLYGMSDHMSLAAVQQGLKVCKYVPFGPIEEVIPYLHRRTQENRGLIARTVKERELLWIEIKRRLTSLEL